MSFRGRSSSARNTQTPSGLRAELLAELMEMGFEKNLAVHAIEISKAMTAEQAAKWIMDNGRDGILTKDYAGNELSHEEKLKRAEQVRRSAQQRRRSKSIDAQVIREREELRRTSETEARFRTEKEQERQKLVEQREKEKEADKQAKAKVLQQLEMDRRARRIRSGRPAKLTAAEKRKEEEKRIAKEKERVERLTKDTYFAKPVGISERLRLKLLEMRRNTDEASFRTACETLLKYIGNVAKQPNNEKFRQIKLTNSVFLQKVALVDGAVEFLEDCGFTQSVDPDYIVLPLKDLVLNVLDAAGTVLNSAMNNPFFV